MESKRIGFSEKSIHAGAKKIVRENWNLRNKMECRNKGGWDFV